MAGLWPRPEGSATRACAGDLADEFDGARFEELDETATGATGDVRLIDAVAQVMARNMEKDERIFVMGEDIHR